MGLRFALALGPLGSHIVILSASVVFRFGSQT